MRLRGGSSQHAPRFLTMGVALVFVVIGVLGTFLGVLPSVGGFSGELIGIWSYIVATVILLLGIFIRGL
ncbi:MAG: hypothetical protein H0X59_02575 [Chloroflexi bacterium]|nr:hypothetical protein [Chloroflexota bacterium]MDQ3407168.1 hypothetical protein [Chloroflexota bacterium]